MPGLLTLKTDLKSLKYGADRPGGGNSGQPYITNNINNPADTLGFDDGLIRGGAVGAAKHSGTDTLRIGKFLTDAPHGPLFIIKQVGLQLSNPRLETKNYFLGAISGLLEPTRLYNLGVNTIAQVPINAFGGHFNRHGILPVQTEASKYEAVVTYNNKNNNNRLVTLVDKLELGPVQSNNSLFAKANSIINQLNNFTGFLGVTIPKLKNNQDVIDSYIGGPGSVYGIGKTTINRTTYTANADEINRAISQSNQYAGRTRDINGNVSTFNISRFLGVSNYSYSVFAPDDFFFKDTGIIALDNTPKNLNDRIPTNTDIENDKEGKYRTNSNINYINTLKLSRDYYTINYPNDAPLTENNISADGKVITYPVATLYSSTTAVGKYAELQKQIEKQKTGSIFIDTEYSRKYSFPIQDGYTQNTISYDNHIDEPIIIKGTWITKNREIRVGSGRQDQINLTPIFKANAGTHGDEVNIPGIGKKNINDLVKFRIQAINTDNPSNADWMIFRAYITQLSDNVDAQWSDIKYAGRGEKFYVYDGFSRKMSVSFKVAALSAQEMKPMYQKLNYLMGNLMPDYSGTLMRGPLMRMTIGNYIDGQLCKLDSLSYTVPQDSPWEISINDTELILPHIIEVNLSFTPIGSQTRDENRLSSKSDKISHIAQNYNAPKDNAGEYINPTLGSILK
jgi:hypothetical protein